MSAYAEKRQIQSRTFDGLVSPAANVPVMSFIVPAGKALEFYNFRAFVSKANTAATILSLTTSAGTALATLPLSAVAEGSVQEAAACASSPVNYITSAGCNGDDTVIHVTPSATLAQFRGTVQVDFSYPGSK